MDNKILNGIIGVLTIGTTVILYGQNKKYKGQIKSLEKNNKELTKEIEKLNYHLGKMSLKKNN